MSTSSTLRTVTSADGTTIAYEQTGEGVPLVMIGGAFNDRSTMTAVAEALVALGGVAPVRYDRRGRGDSGDAAPADETRYDPAREIADLAAVIEAVGGTADVFGHSSGAVLALEAVRAGVPVRRLAVYEPPFRPLDDPRPAPAPDLLQRMIALVAMDRPDETAALFFTESLGLPAEVVAGMRQDEASWSWMRRLAPSLPHDNALFTVDARLPEGRYADLDLPLLAVAGGDSDATLQAGAAGVAAQVRGSRHVVLPGEDHGVLSHPDAIAPLLAEFLVS